MILATHAIIGGALGRLLPNNPVAAFVVGFASHFAADAIPHWQYTLRSFVKDPKDPMKNDIRVNRAFLFDFFRIGLDCLAGFALLFYIFYFHRPLDPSWLSVFWGAVGGVLPDALQFVYYKTRSRALWHLQKFHKWVHGGRTLDDHPALGVPFQVAIVLVILLIPILLISFGSLGGHVAGLSTGR